MASIKIKFRPSTVEGKEGGLYFQIIQNRVIRQMNTDYKIYAYEWDAEIESVVVSGARANILCSIRERMEWDLSRFTLEPRPHYPEIWACGPHRLTQ